MLIGGPIRLGRQRPEPARNGASRSYPWLATVKFTDTAEAGSANPKFHALPSIKHRNFRRYSEISGVSVWLQSDRGDQAERVALLGVGRGVDLEGALVRVGVGAAAGIANDGGEVVH